MRDGYEAWLAAALLETVQRAGAALGLVLAALVAEARVEAVIDAGACDAWLAAARPSDDRDARGESGPAAAVGLAE